MPHVTEHTPKVSTRLVNPYARESSQEKRQQVRWSDRRTDRQTDTQTDCPKPLSRRFEGCTSQIRSYLEVDVLHDANTSIDMEVMAISFEIHIVLVVGHLCFYTTCTGEVTK